MRRKKSFKKTAKKTIAKKEVKTPKSSQKAGSSKPKETATAAVANQEMQKREESSSPEPENIESSPSPGPSVPSPEPARLLRRGRPARMTLLPPSKRPARMTLLPPVARPARMKLIPTARVLPAQRRSNSGSPIAGPSSAYSEQPSSSAGPSTMRAGTSGRDNLPGAVPRTRVLLTPERTTSPRGRELRSPKRDAAKPAENLLRISSKKIIRRRAALRRQMRMIQTKKDSSPSDTTSSGLDSDGLDSSGGNSGDESSAEEPPRSTAKKTRSAQ